MPKTRPSTVVANDPILSALIPKEERAEFELGVKALLARNATLHLLEEVRKEAHISKRSLAEKAGIEESSLRRMLTSETANPSPEKIFRVASALGVKLEAIKPDGRRVSLV